MGKKKNSKKRNSLQPSASKLASAKTLGKFEQFLKKRNWTKKR